ncbi:MAG: hypothetical protein ABFD90_10365 [Phycisphaerales bacterium]
MRDHARENLTELLRQFMDESAAQAAQADIEGAERILDAHPTPAPSPHTLSAVKSLMVIAAARRRRRIHIFRGAVATAAAVVLTVLLGRYGSAPTDQARVNFASIIPTAVWESRDIAADDLDLVYFTSQIHQIETQMRDLEAEDVVPGDNDVLDNIEIELIAIETEFWKG